MVNFRVLDKIEKSIICFKALERIESGATAKDIATKIGCDRNTARDYLDYLYKIKLIKRKRIGNYKVYFPKDLKRSMNIRLYLEDIEKKKTK